MNHAAALVAVLMLIVVAVPAQADPAAPDALGVRAAHGDDALDLGVRLRWTRPGIAALPGRPQPYAEAGLDHLRAGGAKRGPRSLASVSAAAGLRWEHASSAFVELSFGPQLLSRTRLDSRGFGVALQFASSVAVGTELGADRRHEIATYVQHLSNASIARPNNGLTLFGAEYRYKLH